MEKWLLTSLHKLKLPARKKAVHQYVKKMNRAVFFDFQVESSMLRFPVRKKISHVGIANTVDYHYTYKVACASRGREFDIPKILLTESSFLPTHELVNCEYINKIAALTYE